MKKNALILIAFMLLFAACKHETIAPDIEYLNEDAYAKIIEYSSTASSNSNGSFGISSVKDSMGKYKLNLTYHIGYNHTFDSFKVENNAWLKLPEHFDYDVVSNSLSMDNDRIMSFQIKSKTPKDELTIGSVTVPKQTPIAVTELGGNAFRITWVGQNRRQRILIYLYTEYTYQQPYYMGRYAVETADDGEFIFTPEVFEKFEKNVSPFNAQMATEQMRVSLYRNNPSRKTVVKQLSTGKEYEVYGGFADANFIQVLKK
jgi:hypothetical protein